MKFYVEMLGKPFGPFDEEKITKLFSDNKIDLTTRISKDRKNWQTLAETPELTELIEENNDTSLLSIQKKSFQIQSQSSEPPMALNENLPSKTWRYSPDGKNAFGPYTQDEMLPFIQSGNLGPKTIVWEEGQPSHYLISDPTFSGIYRLAITSSNSL